MNPLDLKAYALMVKRRKKNDDDADDYECLIMFFFPSAPSFPPSLVEIVLGKMYEIILRK